MVKAKKDRVEVKRQMKEIQKYITSIERRNQRLDTLCRSYRSAIQKQKKQHLMEVEWRAHLHRKDIIFWRIMWDVQLVMVIALLCKIWFG